MLSINFLVSCVLFAAALLSPVYLQAMETKPFFRYEQEVYSTEKSIELGEETKLHAGLDAHFDKNTNLSIGFDTDPEKNPYDNKTSKLEARLRHFHQSKALVDGFSFGIDVDLKLNDGGGMSLGLDDDSDKTYLGVKINETFTVKFHPFNIGSRVGNRFWTDHVARLFYFEGTPAIVYDIPQDGQSIRMKTVAGLVLHYRPLENLHLYLGGGGAGFDYPSSSNFDVTKDDRAERWGIRRDDALKAGFSYEPVSGFTIHLDYAEHSAAKKAGSKLAAAGSLQLRYDKQALFWDFELGYSKAGKRPYRLSENGKWFKDFDAARRIYADRFRTPHDWIGKTDMAYHFLVGYSVGVLKPYISYAHLGEDYIYSDIDSAERLRTADETSSHGGLSVFGLGLKWVDGPLVLHPLVEYKTAKNKVFGHVEDVRQDRFLRVFETKNILVTLNVAYKL